MRTNEKREELYAELNAVQNMTEEEVCELYNTDCKQDIIDLIKEDIMRLPEEPEPSGMDYAALQRVQGMPVIKW